MGCFARSDDNVPAGQLFFNITHDGSGIAGNDPFLVFDFVHDAALFDKHPHIITSEFAGRPEFGGEAEPE